MKKQLFSFLLLLSFVFSVSAQKAQIARSDSTPANLRKHIEYLASDKLEGRRTGERGATYAAGYIANMFAKFKLKPGARSANGKANYLQPFPYAPAMQNPHGEPSLDLTAKPKDAYNVIGILEGHDKTLKDEAIIIGAHYDHLGRGGAGSLASNSAEIHHGADDNASGTAAIIELARQFAKEKKNKRTLIFIAFSGEEEGLFGSKYYVNNPVFPLEKTVAMLNLDMVGRLKDDKLTIGGIGTASEWRELTLRIAINMPTLGRLKDNHSSNAGSQPKILSAKEEFTLSTVPPFLVTEKSFDLQLNDDGFGPSDHSSFYGKKIPVLFFFTGTHLDYHKPSDTADKINFEGLNKVKSYVAEIVKTIDQTPTRPTYTVAKSTGTAGGRTGFNISLGTIPSYTDSTDGMVLDGVRDDSPAARAGLKGGDKVVKLAGHDIKNVMDYTKTLGQMKAGEEYEIVVVRGTETLMLKIIPVKR